MWYKVSVCKMGYAVIAATMLDVQHKTTAVDTSDTFGVCLATMLNSTVMGDA